MKLIGTFLILLCSMCQTYGQDDTRSQKILDDVTAKFKTYPSVVIDFSATVAQMQDKTESTYQGKIWLKNNKYKLEVPDYTLFFDGTKIYQYMPEVKEVNISQPDVNETDEDLQLLNPQSILKLSSKNFKSNLVQESTQKNRKVYEIDLYPLQVKTTKYSRIRVWIEKTTSQITYLKAYLKDGTQYTLLFEPYSVLKTALSDTYFTFRPADYPGVEVIDLTF